MARDERLVVLAVDLGLELVVPSCLTLISVYPVADALDCRVGPRRVGLG
jgi:hypothetical protein